MPFACDPNTWWVEGGRPQVQSHLQLHEFKVSLGCRDSAAKNKVLFNTLQDLLHKHLRKQNKTKQRLLSFPL